MAPRRVIVSVDLPSALLQRVDCLAQRQERSRKQIIGTAVDQYVARHSAEAVATALNQLAGQADTRPDAPARGAARRVLERADW